jgi:hypothetical protein
LYTWNANTLLSCILEILTHFYLVYLRC